MARHVDVVKNDPAAGVQRRLATLEVTTDRPLVIRSANGDDWQERLERLAGPMNGHTGSEYIDLLTERLADSTYIALTEMHADDDCPFAETDELRIDPRSGHLTNA